MLHTDFFLTQFLDSFIADNEGTNISQFHFKDAQLSAMVMMMIMLFISTTSIITVQICHSDRFLVHVLSCQ